MRNRSNPLRSSELVPGIVLSSHEREEQVWELLPEPWGLGISGSLPAALARHAVIDQNDGWHTFDSFASRVGQESELRDLSTAVGNRALDIGGDAAVVLLALNGLLNVEIANFYREWYGGGLYAPDQDLDVVRQLSVDSRIEMGVAFGLTDADYRMYEGQDQP